MTSHSKSPANRKSGRKSGGPCTTAGKARASRNARRHGLADFQTNPPPVMLAQIAQMVDAICHGDNDADLRQQATRIAENQLWLSAIRAEKLAVLERLREPTAYALDDRRRLARGRARLRLTNVALRQLRVMDQLIAKTQAAGRDPRCEPLPRDLKAAWPPPWAPAAPGPVRDEYAVLREGLCDLVRLLRYEQSAWARRKRAVRGLMAVKVTKQYQTQTEQG